MIRLLIADDHKVLLDGLALLIEQEPDMEILGTAGNGKQVWPILHEHPVDVAVLDINLPVQNGMEVCARITREYPQVKVLALTSYNRGAFIQQMLKAGAAGYVLKSAAAEEIVQAIREVYAGKTYLSSFVSETLMETLRNQPDAVNEFVPQLTKREKQILKLIAAEYTTREIAHELHLSEHTVETHRRNLLTKLNVRNVVGLIRKAMQRGLLD